MPDTSVITPETTDDLAVLTRSEDAAGSPAAAGASQSGSTDVAEVPARRGRARKRAEQPVANSIQGKPGIVAAPSDVEIWEAATQATVWLWVRDGIKGGFKQIHISGHSGAKRAQLTVEERRYNQDLIPDENIGLDPFANGQLICTTGSESASSITDEDLDMIIGLDDDVEYDQAVSDIESEVVLRRLMARAENRATMRRFLAVRDLIDTRYRVGGTQRAVEEMIRAGERISGSAI